MLTLSLVAIDGTVIATAVPSIVEQIGGFSQFPWLFSAYLLTQAVTTPLYGRYADVVGRRPVLLLGIGLFVLGSLLCGLAWSMPVLIAARAVQGLGAGAVQPMVDDDRRRHVHGPGAVQGPGLRRVGLGCLGGDRPALRAASSSEYVSLALGLPRQPAARPARRRADRAPRSARRSSAASTGSTALGAVAARARRAACSSSACSRAASAGRGPARLGVAVLGGGLVLLVVFVLVERRAPEPVLPLWVLSRRVLVAGNLSQVGRRRHAHRPVVVRADLRPERARDRAGRRGPRGRGADRRLADLGEPVGPGLPADRLPGHRAPRLGASSSSAGAACAALGRRDVGLVGRRDVLRHRARDGAGLGAGRRRRPVRRRLGAARRRHLDEHVRPHGRQRRRGRRPRGRRERDDARPAARGAARRRGRPRPTWTPRPPCSPTAPAAPRRCARSSGQALAVAMHHVFVGLVVVAVVIGLGVAAMPRRTRTLDGAEVLEQ